MKENKGEEVVDEAAKPEAQSQPRPAVRNKRKNFSKVIDLENFSKAIDLENLPSRRKGKRVKHKSSKPRVVKSRLPVFPTSQQLFFQIHDMDTEPARDPSSKTIPALSQPFQRAPMNLLENEDLAWERFEQAVTGEDVTACYDMSLKEFEHSGIHDPFKVITFTSSCHSNMYICIYF